MPQNEFNKWEIKSTRKFSLLPATLHHESMAVDLRKLIGRSYSERFVVFRPGIGVGYAPASEVQMLEDYLADKVVNDDAFVRRNLREYAKRERDIVAIGRLTEKLRVRSLSDQQLLRVISNSFATMKAFVAYGPISAKIISNALAREVRQWLKLKLAKQGKIPADEALEQEVNGLIAPSEETLAIKEEKALIKLASEVARNSKLRRYLRNDGSRRQLKHSLIVTFPGFARRFSSHVKKYCWLPVFIESPTWSEADFMKRLLDLTVNKKYIRRLREINEQYHSIHQQQRKYIRQLKPPTNIKRLIKYLGTYLSLRTRFGTMQGYGNYHLEKLYVEAARRARLPLHLFKFMTANEVKDFLQTGRLPSPRVLRDRRKLSVLILKNGQHKILTGKSARQYLERELPSISTGLRKAQVTGIPVFDGVITGIARVVMTASEASKVRMGDILITPMTSPDMVPILRKVKGIVTNEGALTCHAAIISRELKIPCIISTKSATSVFKDGDKVELNTKLSLARKIR